MIVRMSKIMVMGPQDLLMETLSLIQNLGIMQIDTDIQAGSEKPALSGSLTRGEISSVLEHQFYTRLEKKIEELLKHLTFTDRMPGLRARMPVESMASFIPVHLRQVTERSSKIDYLSRELAQLTVYRTVLNALGNIVQENPLDEELDCIGVELAAADDISSLLVRLERDVEGKVFVEKVPENEGPVSYLIITERELSGSISSLLDEYNATGFFPPPGLEKLPFSEKMRIISLQIGERKKQVETLQREQDQFARQWQDAYRKAQDWIRERISLIQVTSSVVRTRMCFFIYGWLPADDFVTLDKELLIRFQGKVVLEESELVEQDFSRVPTALHNPAYFRPFEVFTRLLPMPPYASFDLTPFIGIFFPIFFGMMLGDVGYGIVLIIGAVFLVRKYADRRNIHDIGKILFISSLYSLFFGVMYGEFFGSVGHMYLGMKPILFDRQTTVIPMFCFAIAAGIVHVILGLALGIILSLRRKMKKEAVFKLVNILFILCLCILVVSYFTPTLVAVRVPLLVSIAVSTPVLLLAGGILAPLELLKNIGNIISYVRIMAVGLASVLLAYVANYMGGKIGSVWAGLFVAVILHSFNLLLGVFAPTIHSLRLHYVEFLGKFMEPGGREFTPLGKQ